MMNSIFSALGSSLDYFKRSSKDNSFRGQNSAKEILPFIISFILVIIFITPPILLVGLFLLYFPN